MMKKALFFLVTVFFITACGQSNIAYRADTLSLQIEQNYILLDADLLHKNRQNFRTLYIDKKLLRLKEDNIIIYEDANTDLSYEFAPATTQVIRVIFNAQSVHKIYARNNLYGFQLYLGNNDVLNVIAQQSESQRLRFIYGLTTAQFNSILKQLDPSASTARIGKVITFASMQHLYMARWTTINVDFLPLVQPIPQRLGW